MLFKVYGPRKGEVRWICNMEAVSAEEAFNKACSHFGYLYVTKVEPFNSMCEKCAKMGNGCDGTINQVWTGCVNRIRKEA